MNSEDISIIRKERGKLATAQQRRAANPLRSVWVEASAGTGKTKVLSDRVLRLLLSGVAPSKILCLTYTKAAAVEMSSRIAGRLSRWAVADEETLHKELLALLGELPESQKDYAKLEAMARQLFAVLLDTPGGMKIQTIHSFCQEILKRFPLEAKVSPYFEVMDDRTASEALADVQRGLLLKIEEEPDGFVGQALAFLTRQVSEFKFPQIMETIAANRNKISKLLASFANEEALKEELARRLDVNPAESESSLLRRFMAEINRNDLTAMREAWFKGAATDVKNAEILARLSEDGYPEAAFEAYQKLFLIKDGSPKAKAGSKGALAACPRLDDIFYHEAERLQILQNSLTALRVYASTAAVLTLAGELIGGYNYYKKIHSKMDYEDLIVLTRDLLEDKSVADWVLYKLDGGIDHVLIDEAQDTSPNQWAIVKALTEEFFNHADRVRTVFAVGDRKQSIYSFQGADPREFENMRRYFADKASNFDEVKLEVSFRSTASVLDSVNMVFRDDYAKQGVVLENEDITHIPFRTGDGGKVEIWPLVEPQEGENPDMWRPPVERSVGESTSSRLAKMIAAKIKEQVSRGDILVSQNRPLRYKDYMILVQRRNSFVEEMVRECKNAGVNVAGVDKIRLLEQIAVQDLVALGKFLLLPTDDLTLAEVLKSPLFGLSDDDLFALCYNRGGASVWTRLCDNENYRETYLLLRDLLDMADYVRPFELYAYVLNKQNGRRKFVERMGLEVEDGLDEFVNLTLAYEQEHIPNLQGFIQWIAGDEIEIKRELEQSEADAVRIMTVHGSKGLQAPVVILPDTVRMVNVRKEGGLLWDDLFYYPLSSGDYDKNCCRIKDEETIRANEEYKRLLYVALTRAEDRLCVCGYRQNTAAKDESWYGICKRSLAQLGSDDGAGNVVYETPQRLAVNAEESSESKKFIRPDFPWMTQPAPEENPLAKPYTPSRPDEDDSDVALVSPISDDGSNRYQRGRIIHKLLQFLPDVQAADKRLVIAEFLAKNAPEMSSSQAERIQNEVLRLLEDEKFNPLFAPGSKAEVPIIGEVDGRIISAQVDRLVVTDSEVMIVDFKTNRPAAKSLNEVPAVYFKQLRAYRDLLAKIYSGKTVKSYILWTDTAQIMQIE